MEYVVLKSFLISLRNLPQLLILTVLHRVDLYRRYWNLVILKIHRKYRLFVLRGKSDQFSSLFELLLIDHRLQLVFWYVVVSYEWHLSEFLLMRDKCLIEQRRWSNQKLRGGCGPSRNGKIAVGLDRIEAAFAFGPSRGVLQRRQRLIMQRGSKTDCVLVINNSNSSRWRKLEAFCEGWLHELAWERWIVGVWASCGVNGHFDSCELCVYVTVINAVIVQ